jgi:hypothetical protein
MKNTIKITVADPCHEDWSKMTPTEKGKHCASCQKEVVDFTQKTDEQLFKLVKSGASMCGRFKSTQLDRTIALSRKRNHSFAQYAASLLIPAALLTTQDMKSQQSKTPTSKVQKRYTSLGIGSQQHTFKQRFDPFAFDTIGIVYANGLPVAGAQVSIKDSDRTSLSSAKGNFALEALPGDILVVALDGFDTQEIALDENTPKYKIHMGSGIVEGHTFMVSGVISDESGPLPGATVRIEGTNKGVETDFDGKYTIQAATGEILVFSHLMYLSKTEVVGTNQTISATLHYSNDMIFGEFITTGISVIIESSEDTSIHTPKFDTETPEQKQAREDRKVHQEKVNTWKRFKNRIKKQASKKKD